MHTRYVWVPNRARRRHQIPGAWSFWTAWPRYWELKQQQMLLATSHLNSPQGDILPQNDHYQSLTRPCLFHSYFQQSRDSENQIQKDNLLKVVIYIQRDHWNWNLFKQKGWRGWSWQGQMRRKCLHRNASCSLLSGPRTQKRNMRNGSREELFPDKKSRSAGLAVYGSSEKNTGMLLRLQAELFLCPCVAESETFLQGEGERVTAKAMVSQVRQHGFKFYYYLLLV